MSILRRIGPRLSAWHTVLIATMAASFWLPASAAAQANDDAANCKAAVGYGYRSINGHYYIGTAIRGADALSGKVYYTVSAIDITKTYQMDGTFWVYAFECRSLASLSNIPAERWSVAERSIDDNDDCSGAAGGFYIQQPGYDPGYDPSTGGAGGCADGSGDGVDDPGGYSGPAPTVSVGDSGSGSGCHVEHLTIEISYDSGETWSVLYSGDVRVC